MPETKNHIQKLFTTIKIYQFSTLTLKIRTLNGMYEL